MWPVSSGTLALIILLAALHDGGGGARPSLCCNDGWGRTSNPPVAPSVVGSKHKPDLIETSFKDTATDVNHA
jgi:hypothetical protein